MIAAAIIGSETGDGTTPNLYDDKDIGEIKFYIKSWDRNSTIHFKELRSRVNTALASAILGNEVIKDKVSRINIIIKFQKKSWNGSLIYSGISFWNLNFSNSNFQTNFNCQPNIILAFI